MMGVLWKLLGLEGEGASVLSFQSLLIKPDLQAPRDDLRLMYLWSPIQIPAFSLQLVDNNK